VTAKKHLTVRNPLERETIVPEPIRPQFADKDPKKQGNNVTSHHSDPPSLEQATRQEKPALKRYATYLRPESIKRIQHSAIEQDINDYELVQAAIDHYFEQKI
jgi:hypothetical protein